LITLELQFPLGLDPEGVSGFLLAVLAQRGRRAATTSPFVSEVRMTSQKVRWTLTVPNDLVAVLRRAARRHLVGLQLSTTELSPAIASHAAELWLSDSDRLLTTGAASDVAAGLLSVAHRLGEGEELVQQWVVGPATPRHPIERTATPTPRTWWNLPDWQSAPRTAEAAQAARRKQDEPVFAVVGRIGISGASRHRSGQLIGSLIAALGPLRAPGVAIVRRHTPGFVIKRRITRRSLTGALSRMTPSELAAVLGWPIRNPEVPGVRYQAAPLLPLDRRAISRRPDARRLGVPMGDQQRAGAGVALGITDAMRSVHLLGPSGTGKSTVMAHLILSDIAAGRPVAVVDPKGDLVSDVIARLPESAEDRVVVIDPGDPAPVGFNPLAAGPAGIDTMLHVFQSMWAGSWGPRMGDALHAGALTMALNDERSLVELPLLFTDPTFRRPLVRRAIKRDPIGLGTFWAMWDGWSDELRAQALAPIMNRLRTVLLRPELRAVLGQSEPRFNLADLYTGQRSVLVRLNDGQIGAEGAALLGSLLVASLWQGAQARSKLPADHRTPVVWYLDEFQEVLRLPLDLADALVQARGLGVGLVLAHQHLDQLDRSVRSAVLANAGSRLMFRLDHDDATVMAKRTGGLLRPEHLSSLSPYEAYASILVNGDRTPYGSMRTEPLPPPTRDVGAFLGINRQRWGRPANEVDERLQQLMHGDGRAEPTSTIGGRRRRSPDTEPRP
jgi:hypothetical protein